MKSSTLIEPIETRSAYDLCLAWNWEHDAAFVTWLSQKLAASGLSLLSVSAANLTSILERLARQEVRWLGFWDRAADTDERFTALHPYANEGRCYWINPADRARWAWNKATMHLELITAGLNTPYTLLLDPYELRPDPTPPDLTVLGKEFFIKPAHGGGGEGVIHGAQSWAQVQAARKMHPRDFYLLQARVEPIWFGDRPAWLRAVVAFDRSFICWWNPWTHIYQPLTTVDSQWIDIERVQNMLRVIKRVCGLDIFSSEIALTARQEYIVVDYINDPIDLRLQSQAPDGVPDTIVEGIIDSIIQQLKKRK